MSARGTSDVARLGDALASCAGEAGAPVDAGRIFDALHGELGVEERRKVVDELVLNPAAAEAWRLARELAPEGAGAAAFPVRSRRQWLSLAAAAVLSAALGWQLLERATTPDQPTYRSVEPQTIASTLGADALSRTQPVLRWSAVDGARYRVRVLTPELAVLAESGELIEPEYALPADLLGRMPLPGGILWQVEARIPGSGVVVSPTFSVRIE